MRRKAFHYNILAKEWYESTDEKMNAMDIEQIPAHFIIRTSEHFGEATKNMIWCPSHKTYEEVTAHEGCVLVTVTGCRFEGLFGCVEPAADGHTPVQDIPLRSRLLYNEGLGLVTIFADMATVNFQSIKDLEQEEMTYIPRSRQRKVEGVTVVLKDKKITPQSKLSKIPLSTAKAALTFLKEEGEQLLGHSIKLPSSVNGDVFPSGESILLAFLHHPGDMNLWLLKDYFHSGQDCFGTSSDDNFLDLCHAFHLKPTDYMKTLYDSNPLALPILFVLHILGIKKRELTEPFLTSNTFLGDSVASGLKNVIGYTPLRNVKTGFPTGFIDDEDKIRSLLENRAGWNDTWNPLLFYCHFRLRHEEENALANHLLELNINWEPRFWRTLRLFFHHFPELPEAIRKKIVTEGLTLEVHNEMVRIINRKKLEWPEFTYSDEERGYECEIDGYCFRLIYNSEQYHSVKQNLDFFSTNRTDLPDCGVVRMAIYKGAKPVAYFELHGIALLMAKNHGAIYSDCLRDASVRVAFLHWLKWTGLWEHYGPYYEEDYEVLQEDVIANPVTKIVGMSLYELLHLPDTPKGYYRELYHALMTAKPLCYEVKPPHVYDEKSEMTYLMSLFPYGKRIYEAAFAGNSEAQHVLSLCYSDGGEYHTLFPMDKNRSNYWKYRS